MRVVLRQKYDELASDLATERTARLAAEARVKITTEALALAAWRFEYLAKQLVRHGSPELAPSLNEAAADIRTALHPGDGG